ncbi:MAG: S-methyl-5-thioribose-1-phosphate isomerase [Planctomycetes bacterium]|nr:S-methyl-5-thioribose-1-phosphate isomerase [Planctomycetota bacterium]
MNTLPRTVQWIGDLPGHVRLLDQTLLPTQLAFRDCRTVEEVWKAIRNLRVRGAPAIGIAAAMGVVVGVQAHTESATYAQRFHEVADYLRTSRPTAVNLFWALDRMEKKASPRMSAAIPGVSASLTRLLLTEALAIEQEDREMCRAIGRAGADLVQEGQGILTHCNAGGLATAEYGTALAVMYTAQEQGKKFRVFADETRPLLQGARLTAWELMQAGIDVTLICDNMAAQVMREGRVQLVLVGADRIAANGDTANKIGTYGVSVLAKAHDIPFYVAAPSSTFDLSIADGRQIPIEQRDPREITEGLGKVIAPAGVRVYNPAFDVTPADLITGIITEKGLIQPVNSANIQRTLHV